MKVNPDIARRASDSYYNWSLSSNLENSKQAILVYNGEVYRGLDASTLSSEDINYAQQHVRIISGLYGVLCPLDLIQPYRLEMNTRLENQKMIYYRMKTNWSSPDNFLLMRNQSSAIIVFILNCTLCIL